MIDLFLHLDKHLDTIVASYGTLTYLVLFLIVFCETGLVVTPFLPGDSLLFAAGAVAGAGLLNPFLLGALLIVAAILGDAVNYMIGRYIGPKVFQANDSMFFKKKYLEKTQKFYEKYGGKTIIIARFVPIVRTFAPFLAGVGAMKYSKFGLYNIVGAILWVGIVLTAGVFFGGLPIVKKNFSIVVLGIIFVSILPAVVEFYKEWSSNRKASSGASI